MATTKRNLQLFAVIAVISTIGSGCMLVETNLKVHPDGSSDVQMRMGISKPLLQMRPEGEQDPFAELRQQIEDQPGWTLEPFETDDWRGVIIEGATGPEEGLFPKLPQQEAAPAQRMEISPRLLSTDYTIEAELDAGEMEMPGPPLEAAIQSGRLRFTQAEPGTMKELDKETMGNLFAGLGQKPRISFTIDPPGRITDTNGEIIDDERVEWSPDMAAMMQAGQPPKIHMYVQSSLLNQQNIGRLADKLAAERGLDNMSALIAEYVQHGLLPNPPRQDPLQAALDAAAYDHAISTIVTLEDTLGMPIASRVIRGLQLNRDDVTGAQLRNAWQTVSNIDPDELIEVSAQTVIKHIEMLAD